MNNLLITQSLQNDFVKPIGKNTPLPNLLHIGHKESNRILGEEGTGPLTQFINWAHKSNKLDIIHIRDWHDGSDPGQSSHFEHFGPHCIANEPGSEFVFNIDEPFQEPKIINSTSLNDFINTNLTQILKQYENEKINIGVIGVWTEAKVKFLCYELITRYPNFNVALCSALTAGSNRADHITALNYLERILGIKVFHSNADFSEFLTKDNNYNSTINYSNSLKIEPELNTEEDNLKILKYLFQNCSSISTKVLEGGFSGNIVLSVKGKDIHGHEIVPHVVKIGKSDEMAKERFAFEQVEEILGNNAPAITNFTEYNGKGAIKYRYASLYGDGSQTFQKIFENNYDEKIVNEIINEVFGKQLNRFYRASKVEAANLFDYYWFDSKYADRVKKLVENISGENADGGRITLEGQVLPNVAFFYNSQLDVIKNKISNEFIHSFIHGDLNGANILIDEHRNPWMIDFFHTHKGHILKDLIKFENDLIFIWTKFADKETYNQLCVLLNILIEHEDLIKTPNLSSFLESNNESIVKCAKTITQLRSFYPNLIKSTRDPIQYRIAALRYSVHTMSFEECNDWQKKLALYMSCQLSEKISSSLYGKSELRIDWIKPLSTKGKLGLTILPGRQDRGRSLIEDIRAIKNQGAEIVYCLAEQWELDHYGVSNIMQEYKEMGLNSFHFPAVDQKTLSMRETESLVNEILSLLDSNKSILLHCIGGIGRSGTVAACCLKKLNFSTKEAIEQIREDRSPRAIENEYQENFIEEFKA